MDFTKPLLSGTASFVVGTIGGILAASSAFLPPQWSAVVAIVGFLACTLAGLASGVPKVVAGKPILQGTALALATTVFTLLGQFYAVLPQGWPQSIAIGLAGILAWLTGKALPPLGHPTPEALEAAKVAGLVASNEVSSKAEAVAVLGSGSKP